MYRKIKHTDNKDSLPLNSIVASHFAGVGDSSSNINRANSEHYQLTAFDPLTQKFELSIPDDEVPDGPIYVNGQPIIGKLDNSPLHTLSIKEMADQDYWYMMIR